MRKWYFSIAAKNYKHREDSFRTPQVSGTRFMNGLLIVDFEILMDTFKLAVNRAMSIMQENGATPYRLEGFDLVDLKEIAHMSGLRWNAAVTLANAAGDDPMPCPVARVSSERPLWKWSEVAAWLGARDLVSLETVEIARFVDATNYRLDAEA